MNSENVDTEPSLLMHKLPCAHFFFWGGGGMGGRVHSVQGTTQFVDHKLARIHAYSIRATNSD